MLVFCPDFGYNRGADGFCHIERLEAVNMDEERDIVVFEDDAGNELTMEVLDYLSYEGKEYALLTELVEDEAEDDEDEDVEAFIMEVRPVGDDQEEFVPVDDDLAEQLLAIFESEDYDDVYEDEEEDEEE